METKELLGRIESLELKLVDFFHDVAALRRAVISCEMPDNILKAELMRYGEGIDLAENQLKDNKVSGVVNDTLISNRMIDSSITPDQHLINPDFIMASSVVEKEQSNTHTVKNIQSERQSLHFIDVNSGNIATVDPEIMPADGYNRTHNETVPLSEGVGLFIAEPSSTSISNSEQLTISEIAQAAIATTSNQESLEQLSGHYWNTVDVEHKDTPTQNMNQSPELNNACNNTSNNACNSNSAPLVKNESINMSSRHPDAFAANQLINDELWQQYMNNNSDPLKNASDNKGLTDQNYRSYQSLVKRYYENYHICNVNFGERSEGECLFCLSLLRKHN